MRRLKLKCKSRKVITVGRSFKRLEDVGNFFKLSKNIVVDFQQFTPLHIDLKEFYIEYIEVYLPKLNNFIKDFNIDSITYLRPTFDRSFGSRIQILKKIGRKDRVLNLFEFYKLLDSYFNSHLNDSVLIQLINREREISNYIIDRSISYKTLYNSLGLEDSYHLAFSGTKPDSKKSIKEIGERVLIYNKYSIKKNSSPIFPFPLFNRELKIEDNIEGINKESPCINCNKCNQYCPEAIYPQYYYHYLNEDLIEECQKLKINSCTRCGICSFVCPSNIPIKESITEYFINEEKEFGDL